MTRVQCKNKYCKEQPSEHDTLEGYCMICAAERVRGYETAWAAGYKAALKLFAWWKDGVQYVGSCGTTLEEALKEVTE